MKLASLLLATFAVCASAQAAPRTVDRMTCDGARAFVIQHKRYYVQTGDGAIPIYPVIPVNQNPVCGKKERVSYSVVRTSDNARCVVGYQCISN